MGKPEKEIQGYSDDPRQWKNSEEMKNKIHLRRQVKPARSWPSSFLELPIAVQT